VQIVRDDFGIISGIGPIFCKRKNKHNTKMLLTVANTLVYAVAIISGIFYEQVFPTDELKSLYMLILLISVFIHVPMYFKSLRVFALFFGCCFFVTTMIEEYSIATGFPFGRFEHLLSREHLGHIKTFGFIYPQSNVPVMVSAFWVRSDYIHCASSFVI